MDPSTDFMADLIEGSHKRVTTMAAPLTSDQRVASPWGQGSYHEIVVF